jgi:predicted lipid-binding transport protein (Tim44 family)
MVGRLVNGVVGGLAGGLLFGVLMQTIGMIPMVAMLVGSKSVVVGWRIDSYHASTADNAIIVTTNSPARAARTPPTTEPRSTRRRSCGSCRPTTPPTRGAGLQGVVDRVDRVIAITPPVVGSRR